MAAAVRRAVQMLGTATVCLLLASPVGAVRVVQQEELTLRVGEALDEELVVLATSVRMEGTVRDDLFLLANEQFLGGTFESAIAAAGEKITLTGRVQRHARLLANVVSLEGAEVGAGALLLGPTVRIDDDSMLHGRVRVVAQDAILRGRVGQTLRVRARRVRIGGEIVGDVEIHADDLVILPGTRIHGDLVAFLPHPAVLDPRVQVDGQIMMGPAPPTDDARSRILVRVYLYLAAVLSLLPFVALLPRASARAERRLRTAPWRCGLCGALLFGAVPLMAGISMVTIIGIPLALILAGGYVLLAWFAQGAVALLIGFTLRGGSSRDSLGGRCLALLTGLAVLHLAAALPAVGGGIALAALLFGQGAWCLAVRDGELAAREGTG